jgi:hypothetical protein
MQWRTSGCWWVSVEEQLTQDLAKEKINILRLFAEFENYKDQRAYRII